MTETPSRQGRRRRGSIDPRKFDPMRPLVESGAVVVPETADIIQKHMEEWRAASVARGALLPGGRGPLTDEITALARSAVAEGVGDMVEVMHRGEDRDRVRAFEALVKAAQLGGELGLSAEESLREFVKAARASSEARVAARPAGPPTIDGRIVSGRTERNS